MIPPKIKACTCGNCKHLEKELKTRWDGRRSDYTYRCDRDGRSLAVVDFACGLWEADE